MDLDSGLVLSKTEAKIAKTHFQMLMASGFFYGKKG
jgi:hypothetical protein